ncbi:MAG: carbohydrate ABC transporter permease [Candidatus Auribacterota bacterium]|nr:carbohydrate ABC transporter permease [Candidatus Auribacterota bacterium]
MNGYKNKTNISPRILVYLMLAIGGITMVFPFIWMVCTSFKSPLEVLSAQISLIPEEKKYLRIDDGLEQVEFALLLRLQREISGREGEMIEAIGSESSGGNQLRNSLTNEFSAFRRELEEYFRRYHSPSEVVSASHEYYQAMVKNLPDSLRNKLYDQLLLLGERLDQLTRASRDDKDRVQVVILAGEKRGEKSTVEVDEIIYKRFLWRNFVKAWQAAPFARYFINSIFISVIVTIGQVITSALAAYAFARMKFRFKEPLFFLLLATMMIPKQVILIPDYAIISWFRWVNTYYGLIVPFIAAVFGIYFMRQHFETLPQDLFDAASIDGCGRLRILFQVVLPISRPVILTVALFTFIMTWNSLLWPLVMTNTPEMRPLQVGLAVFNQESGTDWELLMAASTFSILPLMVIFFIAQKQFIEGITRSGMKG